MRSPRVWVQAFVVLAVLLIVGGWFLGISPRLDEAARADEQTADVEANNQAQRLRLAQLQKDFERLPELRAELAEIRRSLPAMPDLDRLSVELSQLAGRASVDLTSLTFGLPQNFAPAAADEESAALASGQLATIEVSLALTGAYPDIKAFINRLQTAGRLFLVTSFTLTTADAADRPNTATVVGLVYVLIDPEATPIVAPPAEDAPASTDDSEGDSSGANSDSEG